MYERFTDRARRVMQFANHEAQLHNHEYVGVEHILLGLVKEGTGVGANALRNCGIDLDRIRHEVGTRIRSGPDCITMGRLPQTPRVKNVIEGAIEHAKANTHNYVGTEHLLLALLDQSEGVSSEVFNAMEIDREKVRSQIKKVWLENRGTTVPLLRTRTMALSSGRHWTLQDGTNEVGLWITGALDRAIWLDLKTLVDSLEPKEDPT